MSEHTDRVRNSTAVSSLRETSALLTGMASQEWDAEEERNLVDRLGRVVRDPFLRMAVADPNLIPTNLLAELEGPTQAILEIVQNLEPSAPNANINLSRANEQTDELLVAAAALPAMPSATTDETIQNAIEEVNYEASSAVLSISDKVSELHSAMQKMESTVQDAKSESAELGPVHATVPHYVVNIPNVQR